MNSEKGIQTIWEYEVRSNHIAQFQNTYVPNGNWVRLFQKCPGYLKTELKRNLDTPNRFLTVDYWQSYSDFSSMKLIIADEYRILDKLCEVYTLSENHLGVFESVGDTGICT